MKGMKIYWLIFLNNHVLIFLLSLLDDIPVEMSIYNSLLFFDEEISIMAVA